MNFRLRKVSVNHADCSLIRSYGPEDFEHFTFRNAVLISASIQITNILKKVGYLDLKFTLFLGEYDMNAEIKWRLRGGS